MQIEEEDDDFFTIIKINMIPYNQILDIRCRQLNRYKRNDEPHLMKQRY